MPITTKILKKIQIKMTFKKNYQINLKNYLKVKKIKNKQKNNSMKINAMRKI